MSWTKAEITTVLDQVSRRKKCPESTKIATHSGMFCLIQLIRENNLSFGQQNWDWKVKTRGYFSKNFLKYFLKWKNEEIFYCGRLNTLLQVYSNLKSCLVFFLRVSHFFSCHEMATSSRSFLALVSSIKWVQGTVDCAYESCTVQCTVSLQDQNEMDQVK